MILFFDAETTGLVKNWVNSFDSANPDLVQLGFTFCDKNGRSLFTSGSIIKPYYDRQIEHGAFEAHKISKEMAEEHGKGYGEVLSEFKYWMAKCDLLVAHNIKFDKCVIEKAMNCLLPKDIKTYCTMLESTDICQVPKKSGSGHKWPKLSEAYWYFFEEELKDAHDAMTDVMACKRIFFEGLKAHEKFV